MIREFVEVYSSPKHVVADLAGTIPGVNVVLRDRRVGTITRVDGAFRLTDVPARTDPLRARFVGFQMTLSR